MAVLEDYLVRSCTDLAEFAALVEIDIPFIAVRLPTPCTYFLPGCMLASELVIIDPKRDRALRSPPSS